MLMKLKQFTDNGINNQCIIAKEKNFLPKNTDGTRRPRVDPGTSDIADKTHTMRLWRL